MIKKSISSSKLIYSPIENDVKEFILNPMQHLIGSMDMSVDFSNDKIGIDASLLIIYFEKSNRFHISYTYDDKEQDKNLISSNGTDSKEICSSFVGSDLYYVYENTLISPENTLQVVTDFLEDGRNSNIIQWTNYVETEYPPNLELL